MKYILHKIFVVFTCTTIWMLPLQAQEKLTLTDLSFFQNPGPSWQIAGNVHNAMNEGGILAVVPGTGLLVNIPDGNHRGQDIISIQQFGGMDIELDFMMAPGSNSGIYLQGRYEVQLLDSWGTVRPTSADNGGIYERWNDSLPKGHNGYDGHSPRQNVSRAPGLWQHMKISFQAPRFNTTGKKTENARMLRVELNGVLIQENIELSGPTRGALGNDEAGMGPLRLQGDHGSVAFRNIKITSFDAPLPALTKLNYSIYKGVYPDEMPDKKVKPDFTGNPELMSMNISSLPPSFLIHYTGSLQIKAAGDYFFNMNMAGGRGLLRINNQDVIALAQGHGRGSGHILLQAGEFPFDLMYSKIVVWDKPSVGLEVSGPGIRPFRISDANPGADHENPILVEADVNTILRSFSDIDSFKVTHAVNVGSPLLVNYTYDLDKGKIVQIWRGDFLDVSTMWQGRGDGTSHPLGTVVQFGRPEPEIEKLETIQSPWTSDTSGSAFRTKGYVLNESDLPTFRYLIYQTPVSDRIRVLPDGHGIHREIMLEKPVDNLYLKLATASSIEMLSEGIYLLADKSYYIRMDDASTAKPVIRDAKGNKELIIPFHQGINYTILF